MRLPHDSEKAAVVEAMFDRIAPRYDLMNRVMTLGMDRAWRRHTIEALGLGPGDLVVDLACGTGDLSIEAEKAGARVLGVDFSARMLRLAAGKAPGCAFVRADALSLPLPDGRCDGVISGFAVRNFVSLPGVFEECARVLRAGGGLALLEVDSPASPLLRAGHRIYLHKLVPLMGRLVDREAYSYLPSSTVYLPEEQELVGMLERAGFEAINKKRFLAGAVQLVTARRGPRNPK